MGTQGTRTTDEKPSQRIKVENTPSISALPAEQIHAESLNAGQSSTPAPPFKENKPDTTKPDKAAAAAAAENVKYDGERNSKDSPQATRIQEEKSNRAAEKSQDKPAGESADKPKEHRQQAEQAATNEDHFETMFGQSPTDNDKNNDLNFDLNLSADNLGSSNPFDSAPHDANNLELLPGLESYANASGDEFTMLNVAASTTENPKGVQATNNNFDLPEIQGDSNFNDLFADGDFGGDASLMDLDLEDGFFNT